MTQYVLIILYFEITEEISVTKIHIKMLQMDLESKQTKMSTTPWK